MGIFSKNPRISYHINMSRKVDHISKFIFVILIRIVGRSASATYADIAFLVQSNFNKHEKTLRLIYPATIPCMIVLSLIKLIGLRMTIALLFSVASYIFVAG